MSDDFREHARRDLQFARSVNVRLIEQALAMRCRSYLAQVKAQLLTDTILEIDQRKKVLSNMNSRLEREVAVRKATELRLQQALTQAEAAFRTKSQLMAMVTHDLKGPLTVMGINLKLLGEAPELAAESRSLVAELVAAEERMAGLVSEVLTGRGHADTRLEAHRADVNLHQLANVVLRDHAVQAREKQVELVNEVPVDHLLSADDVLLREALDNLVSNAIKYSRHGGVVRIALAERSGVTVSDSGVGMPPERKQAVLRGTLVESTEGTDGELGTGLGLRLVRAVVDAHGGELCIESREGEGSRFMLLLPRRA